MRVEDTLKLLDAGYTREEILKLSSILLNCRIAVKRI